MYNLYSQTNYSGPQVPYESCNNCTSSNYQYSGTIEYFDTRNVVSDFGPRYLSSNRPYDFHGGIDYTITEPTGTEDLGYHVKAIEEGTIIKLENYQRQNGSRSTLKYVVIDDSEGDNDYGYVHLFDDTSLPTQIGDMKYVEIHDTFPMKKTYGILDLTNNVLYSDCQGGDCDSTFYYINGLDTIYATNHINQEDNIGILGTSGHVLSHLHLSKYNSLNVSDFVNNDINAIDPLEEIWHQGPDYDIKILYNTTVSNIDDYPEGIKIKYPGTDYTDILIRPIMPDMENGQPNNGPLYNDNTLNIHKVEILLGEKSLEGQPQSYHIIRGPFYESKFWLGGRLNENQKYPEHIAIGHPNNEGSWDRTGIKPLAYKDYDPRRWDDFYYADFVTRIHSDDQMEIANCPEKARYNDGNYQVKAVVTNVRGDTYEGPKDATGNLTPIEFTLDNFKPYVQKVRIKTNYNDQEIYYEDWSCFDNNYIIFSKNDLVTEVNAADFSAGMKVYVEKTSEPLQELKMSVPAFEISNRQPIITGSNNDYFVFEIDQSEIVLGLDVVFHFSGKDYNNNDLIAFNKSHRDRNIFVPTRQSNTTWQDNNSPQLTYGVDRIHWLYFSCNNSGGNRRNPDEFATRNSPLEGTEIIINGEELELSAITTNAFTSQCNNGSIDLTVTGGVPPYEYKWSNGATTEDLNGVLPGGYCVSVKDALCGESEDCYVVDNDNSKVVVKNVVNNTECLPKANIYSCDGSIDIEVEGSSGPYSYQWENFEDPGWSSTVEDPQNLCPGVYKVTVTHSSGCTIESIPLRICCCELFSIHDDDESVSCYNNELNENDFSLSADVHSVDSPTSTDGWIDLTVTWQQSGAHPSLIYSWTGPNGFTANTEDIYNLGPGNYCVTVTDGCNTHSDCYEVVDCSSSDLQSSAQVSNTCQGYCYGKIELITTGGIPPYQYLWDDGSSGQQNDNLCKGYHYVTVTDASGCYNELQIFVNDNKNFDKIGSTNPCGWYLGCNGREVKFIPHEKLVCVFDDPFDCTRVNCYCPVTGGYVDGYNEEYLQYKLDWKNCALIGLCPNGEGWEVVQYGNRVTGYYYVEVCPNCYQCYYIDICYMGNDFFVYAFYPVGDSNCGGKGPGESLISSSLRLNELEYILRRDSLIDGIDSTSTMLIAEGLSDTLFMQEYLDLLENIKLQSDTILVYPFEKSKQLTEIDCSNKNCGDNTIESMRSNSNNNNGDIKYNISILPNPFSNELSINLYNLDITNSNITVEISSIIGQTLIVDKIKSINHTIETSKLSEGVYICTIKKEGTIIKIQKIIKQ